MMDFPQGKYQIIYADPPWAYRSQGTGAKARGTARKHYQTMTTEEICSLPVREICAGKNSVCFMWATCPNVGEALRVMKAWGFEYKTVAFVWIKKNRKSGTNFLGMGSYTRANAEFCLLGITPGTKSKKLVKDHGVRQIVESPIRQHSRKPAEVRDLIVRLLGDLPRIELFAREKVPGWDVWGNEIAGNGEAAK